MSREQRPASRMLVVLLLVLGLGAQGCAGSIPSASGFVTPPDDGASASPNTPDVQLAADHDGKLLPPATSINGLDAAAAAKTLATAIITGNDTTVPALVAAVSASGITIRDLDQSVARPATEPASGAIFLAGQIIAMGKLETRGEPISMTEFAASVATLGYGRTEADAGESLGTALIDEIRVAAASDVPTTAFWGLLLTELGRQGAGHYDLLDTESPNPSVTIDAVQASFLLAHLVQVAAAGEPAASRNPSLALAGGPTPPTVRLAAAANLGPCAALNDVQALLSNVSDKLLGGALSKILETWLSKGADFALKVISAVWLILNYMLGQMIFDENLDLTAGGNPIVRTTSTTSPGDAPATVRATLKIDSSGSAYAQCFKHLAAAVGIGVELNSEGALQSARIGWMIDGDVLEFAKGECKTNCEAITDEHGQTEIDVEGQMQRRALPKHPVKEMKTVRISYILLPSKSDTNFWRDLAGASGFVFSVAQGGAAAFWASVDLALELIQRIGDRGGSLMVEVKDWRQDWPATIRFVADGTTAIKSGPSALSTLYSIDITLGREISTDANGETSDSTARYRVKADAAAFGATSGVTYRPAVGGDNVQCVWSPATGAVGIGGDITLTLDPKLNLITPEFNLSVVDLPNAKTGDQSCTRGETPPYHEDGSPQGQNVLVGRFAAAGVTAPFPAVHDTAQRTDGLYTMNFRWFITPGEDN